MYKTVGESVATALDLKPLVANANHCEVIIAPVFTAIKTVADRMEGSNILIAGQNCSTEVEEGAHTGEIAAFMLETPRALCYCGHSETPTVGESDSMGGRKCGLTFGGLLLSSSAKPATTRQGLAEKVVAGI